MKKARLLIIILAFISTIIPSEAQFDKFKDKIKVPNKAGNLMSSELVDKAKDALRNKMINARKEYDESNFNYAISLSDNAALFESKARFERQRTLLIAAFSAGENTTPADQAAQYNDAGEMLYANGKYRQAEKSFEKAEKTYRESNDTNSIQYIQIISNQALLFHSMGRYEQAEKLTLKALNKRKGLSSEAAAGAVAASVNNLGVLYKDLGRYNEAEQMLEESISKNKAAKGEKSVPYAIALNNQAILYQALGRYQTAEPIMKKALDIAAAALGEKSDNYLRMMTNLALLYQDQGKYNDAEVIYKNAMRIKETKLGTNHPDYAHLLNNLASLYMKMEKYEEVEKLLKKALDIYKSKFGETNPSYAATLSNLGNYYRVKDKNTESLDALAKTEQIRKQTLGENHPDYVKSLYDLALIQWQVGKIAEAQNTFKDVFSKTSNQIKTFFVPMSESEKTRFWEKVSPRFEVYNSFAAANSTPEILTTAYNNRLSTKGILLSSTSKSKNLILNGKDEQIKKLYLSWIDKKEQLAKTYSMTKEDIADEKINIDSLEKVANDLEKQLSTKSSLFNQGYSSGEITFSSIVSKLLPGDAALEIIRLRKFDKTFKDSIYYMFLAGLPNAKSPQVKVLKNGMELETKYFKYYRNNIKLKEEDENSYGVYWEPVSSMLKTSKKVYTSLDGIYNQVSLNSLKIGENKYLPDDKQLVFVSNTKDIIGLKKPAIPAQANTAILFGNPVYGGSGKIANLPGTKIEVEKINGLLKTSAFKPTLFMQMNASEENVKKIKNPGVLHIATHGFFKPNEDKAESVFGISAEHANENPMLRSGLLLADAEKNMEGTEKNPDVSGKDNGILTAYEVSNLALDKTDLVVLSACETGLGDVKAGEGVYGLQRAFAVAGANSLIMSLWTVNDEATLALMTSFYKNWIASKNKQQAFVAAQKELRVKFKHPYYWAAFVLVE